MVISEMDQVAEGVNTLKQVKAKADELGVKMPLVNGLYEIMYNNQTVDHIISSLMLEEHGLDVEFAAGRPRP
jgi:glycerol-3-phosphate dehydrogenase (NAD(P)+)